MIKSVVLWKIIMRKVESFNGSQRLTNRVHPDVSSSFDGICRSLEVSPRQDRVIHVIHTLPKKFKGLQVEICDSKQINDIVVAFFIHGVGGSAAVWNEQVKYFAKEGYEVVVFDIIGHGLSSRPREKGAYKFSELASDCLFVFDLFRKRHNVLVGHSYGSSFCTLIARERSQAVTKIVLISGGGPTTLEPETCSTFCLPHPVFACMKPVLLYLFRRSAFHRNAKDSVRSKVSTFGIPAHVLQAVMQGQHWPDANEEYHSHLMLPVLLIYGKGDRYVSLEDEIWMNETIYGSKLEVVENAGHMVMIEAPAIVNELIHTFLNRDATTASRRVVPSAICEGAPTSCSSELCESVASSRNQDCYPTLGGTPVVLASGDCSLSFCACAMSDPSDASFRADRYHRKTMF